MAVGFMVMTNKMKSLFGSKINQRSSFMKNILPSLSIMLLLSLQPLYAGFKEGEIAYKKGDYRTALNEFIPLAKQGDGRAQNSLGDMYGAGKGVEQDHEQSSYWYDKAAEQGSPADKYKLGGMYYSGNGVDQDSKKAVYWYNKAAEQGDIKAQYELGVMYIKGESVNQDSKKAFYWHMRAAIQGDSRAQESVGWAYHFGWGVNKDSEQSTYWSRKANETRLNEMLQRK